MIPITFFGLLVSVGMITPAAADLYIPMPNGGGFFVPEVFVVVFLALVFFLPPILDNSSKSTNSMDVIATMEAAENYDDQAAQLRAIKRKLDAETELAESYLKAARTKAELDEIEWALGPDKSTRR